MGWKLIDKPKTLKVTKKLAQTFSEMDPAPHDRPLSERRLMVYRRVLKEGGFRPVTWASAICQETGGLYRVNGKHTSIMLSSMDPMPEFYAVVEEYECETLEDVAKLYATFDSSIQSRSALDIYMSFAGTVPELKGISAMTIRTAVAGIVMHENGGTPDNNRATQAADRAESLLEHPDFVVWLDEILAKGRNGKRDVGGSRHLRRSPVAAAMMGCYKKSKAAATEFWTAVREETGISPDLPDRKLAKYLTGCALETAAKSKVIKYATPREMYVRCIHAWNAWRRKESTNLRYQAEADVPSFK